MSASASPPPNSGSSSITIRQARDADGVRIRLLVTRALLEAGLDIPTVETDSDLVEPGYYREPGRGMWVATEGERIVGCVAIDQGDDGHAILRRLAGVSLADLTAAAVAFARGRGYRGVETVLPEPMEDAREAVTSEGFSNDHASNELLFRLAL